MCIFRVGVHRTIDVAPRLGFPGNSGEAEQGPYSVLVDCKGRFVIVAGSFGFGMTGCHVAPQHAAAVTVVILGNGLVKKFTCLFVIAAIH